MFFERYNYLLLMVQQGTACPLSCVVSEIFYFILCQFYQNETKGTSYQSQHIR